MLWCHLALRKTLLVSKRKAANYFLLLNNISLQNVIPYFNKLWSFESLFHEKKIFCRRDLEFETKQGKNPEFWINKYLSDTDGVKFRLNNRKAIMIDFWSTIQSRLSVQLFHDNLIKNASRGHYEMLRVFYKSVVVEGNRSNRALTRTKVFDLGSEWFKSYACRSWIWFLPVLLLLLNKV